MNSAKLLTLIWIWRRRKHRNNAQKKKMRRYWVRPIFELRQRERQGLFANLVAEMRISDDGTFENFHRMPAKVFDDLLNIIGPHISKVDVRRPPIPAGARLSLTLRFLAAGESMTSLSYSYRVGLNTASEIITETTQAIWHNLKNKVLPLPTASDLIKVSDSFLSKWQFPNCAGAIDGKHITIQAPPNSGSEYYNYKGRHSIVLLAVADADYGFLYVDVGSQGRQSDGGIFKNSQLGRALQAQQLNFPELKTISDSRPPMPFCFVGDEAFPLSTFLMRPYSLRGGLDREKRIFNYRLSRARRVVENAFGLLVAKWRIFSKPIICKLETVDQIVLATICLHNFILKSNNAPSYNAPGLLDTETENGILQPGSWRDMPNTGITDIGRTGANTYTRLACSYRDQFKQYFSEEGSVPWQENRI